MSLYATLMGPAFDTLAPVLRQFHHRGGEATGVLDVRHGPGRLARILARRLGLPPEGPNTPVTLRVDAREREEIWCRCFGASRLRTRQWASAGLLVESWGSLRLHFRLRAIDGALVYEQVRCRMLGAPWPARLSPIVHARASAAGDGWDIDVAIQAPGIGPLCSYRGRMHPL